ncbi:MAG TPA: hypothetical protein VMF69_00070 [Gemmataceae bacterium]|nr:hypothetical protein [Gemmataceae bacterium]
MHDRRRRIRVQARPVLLWTLIFFLAGHLAAGRYLHRHHPELFDPEVSLRLRKLPARLAEMPDRPLALALGSSRIVLGFRPASVMEQTSASDPQAVLFNFSMLGTGPVGERLVLHRLLQKGIRPKWLFLEVYSPILTQSFPFVEEVRTFRRDVYWSDVPIIDCLYHRRWEAIGRVIAQTLTPMLDYRESVLEHYLPSVIPPMLKQLCDRGFEKCLPYRLDDYGWVEYDIRDDGSHAERARHFTKPLYDHFRIDEVADRALSDLLAECRAHHIQVVFLLMPDHSMVREWYGSIQDKFLPYLRRLSAENHAPIVDARAWQPDEDIPDCCHLSPKGARSFSERFGREVYRPLLQGRPLPQDVILRDP